MLCSINDVISSTNSIHLLSATKKTEAASGSAIRVGRDLASWAKSLLQTRPATASCMTCRVPAWAKNLLSSPFFLSPRVNSVFCRIHSSILQTNKSGVRCRILVKWLYREKREGGFLFQPTPIKEVMAAAREWTDDITSVFSPVRYWFWGQSILPTVVFILFSRRCMLWKQMSGAGHYWLTSSISSLILIRSLDRKVTARRLLSTMRVHARESPSDLKSSSPILGVASLAITFCVLLALAILQLAFGAVYRGQCSINSNIPVYLIVAGVCGIAALLPGLIMVSDSLSCPTRAPRFFSRVRQS